MNKQEETMKRRLRVHDDAGAFVGLEGDYAIDAAGVRSEYQDVMAGLEQAARRVARCD